MQKSLDKPSPNQTALVSESPSTRTDESESAAEEKRSDNDVATIMMKPCDSSVDQIPLRSSTLTLSKYDEKMPRHGSAMIPSMRKLSQTVQAVARKNSHEESIEAKTSSAAMLRKSLEGHKVRSPLSRGVINIQSLSLIEIDGVLEDCQEQSPSNNPKVILDALKPDPEEIYMKETSILQELVKRRRTFLSFLVGVFTALFITGCISVSVGLSYDKSLPAQLIGVVMVTIGLIGCVTVIYFIMKPDKELKEKIERREKMFSTFKEIATEQQVSNSKMKFTGAGDDKQDNRMFYSSV